MRFTDVKTVKRLFFFALLIVIICFVAFLIFRSFYYRHVDVVIDPGHGGDDYGAVFEERKEKDDNLALALLVADELDKRDISYKLTRQADKFISLEKRCITANERAASLFVALHRNSAENARGAEIWIHSLEPYEDKLLAVSILSELNKTSISSNRGVKTGYAGDKDKNYFVNSHTEMPSCLVELGFITDKTDNSLYDENLHEYAAAIAEGIEKTLSELNIE